jgi:hypothetical protein
VSEGYSVHDHDHDHDRQGGWTETELATLAALAET